MISFLRATNSKLLTCTLLLMSACGAQDGADSSGGGADTGPAAGENTATTSEALTLSFMDTCNIISYTRNRTTNQLLIRADCEKIDHSWNFDVSFNGVCWTDVANCNGALRCGSCKNYY